MWFRNLRPFRLSERLKVSAEELDQRLSSGSFVPCRPAQPHSIGWIPALSDAAETMVHVAGPYWLVRLRREEKLLPATVIKEEVSNRIVQTQIAEGRKVYRKEKLQITDEVVQDLMPRAFTQSKAIDALIEERKGWIWVNNASAPRGEDLISALREATGGLPVVLPSTRKSPAMVMSEWILHNNLPYGFELGNEADLVEPGEDGGVVRVRGMALDCDEVRSHIESGKQVQRLALDWQGRLSFVLGADLALRRLKFSEELVDSNEELKDDFLARRDADFLLMSDAIAELWPMLLEAFGGLEE